MSFSATWRRFLCTFSGADAIIDVASNRPRALRGRVPAALIGAFEDLFDEYPIQDVAITIKRTSDCPRIGFLGGPVPKRDQRIRNVIGVYFR